MKRFVLIVLVALVGSLLAACGKSTLPTQSFAPVAGVTALTAAADGGLRFGKLDGTVSSADKNGAVATAALGTLPVDDNGVLALTVDAKQRTFAAFVDKASQTFQVAQVDAGTNRVIYRSAASSSERHAALATTPEQRILVAYGSTILSLDPDRSDSQPANTISSGWNHLSGIAYAAGNMLWAADGDTNSNGRIARATDAGPTGKTTAPKDAPLSMTAFGDSELAVCLADTTTLKRYFISNAVQALSGRTVANDCTGSVATLEDGRIAYATVTEIRVNVL